MNDQLKKKIVVRNALCWGAALMLPSVVMVILDLFDKHTPTSVAIFSGIFMMPLFVLSNVMLNKGLQEIANNESDA